MTTPTTASIQLLQRQAASLLLYQNVLGDSVGTAFVNLLQTIRHSDPDGLNCLQAYGSWFKALAAEGQTWQNYLLRQILLDDNPFTQQAQLTSIENLSPTLTAAAQHDLQALQGLYQCSSEQLYYWVQVTSECSTDPIPWHQESQQEEPAFASMSSQLQQLDNWGEAVEDLAVYYRKYGTGLFAQYQALRWHSTQLVGITHPDSTQLQELVGYESQKATLIKNTEFLLAGYPALHVLLYGSRGTGKSSLVKGLLAKYRDRGLRIVEVAKSDLKILPTIVEQLRDVPQKFIIFVDDLSFEEDDDTFKALKVVLEGNITARPSNVVVYATSNRRHLVREFFADRPRPSDQDEVNAWDTMQEKLSFSDRFGLTLTFEPANQDTYLKMIRHLAKLKEIAINPEELEYQALQWATRHNGRSGRTARQFIDFLQADLANKRMGNGE
ncbi:MAG: ATP-binding protein [Symploca sp. SIO1B1]|nr:ATP-binding protein [Symploca sp. SIO1B1]